MKKNKLLLLLTVFFLAILNPVQAKTEGKSINNAPVSAIAVASQAKISNIDPIVYVRCKRTTAELDLTDEITVNGETKTVTRRMKGLDSFDQLPDVRKLLSETQISRFAAPCDLVYREASGVERILYNCSSTSTPAEACTAMDPAVSFDGKTIAFSVFRGSLINITTRPATTVLNPSADIGYLERKTLPNTELSSKEAQLYLVDVATGNLTPLPYVENEFDTAPAFLADGRLAFTSTRDKNYTTLVYGTSRTDRGTRIWSMDLDGKNIDLSSHHSTSKEEHPFQLKDGRLAYSSWQIFGARPFRHGRGGGAFDTTDNLFHIYTQSPDGANNFAFFGQHSGDHRASYYGQTHNAAHFLAQTSDERVWFADYYRGNNLGFGDLIGVMPEPEGQEGMEPINEAQSDADKFVPRDIIRFSAWSSNEDAHSKPMPAPAYHHPSYSDPLPYAGNVSHPAALTNNGLMLSWAKGPCNSNTGNRVFGWSHDQQKYPATTLDIPGCDTGLYRATKIPSNHPNDLEMIVDSPDWHEIMPRAVVPYQAIHGVEKPVIIESAEKLNTHPELEAGTPFGLLGAASIIDRETFPRDGIHFKGEKQFSQQGTDTILYGDDDLCGVRILGVMPNRGKLTHREIANLAGERVSILGEFAVRNKDISGNTIIDTSGNPDTSFLVKMPANMPYLMQSIDCDGRTLNTDMTWQSLRPGEKKTCGGCHVHSREPNVKFVDTFANTSAYNIPHLGEGVVPLLTGKTNGEVGVRTVDGYGLSVDFVRDIMPIFQNRCASCHSGSSPDGGLDLTRSGTEGAVNGSPASTWYCLVKDSKQQCVATEDRFRTHYTGGPKDYTFSRPQVSRYVRAFNSRGSLLYWKAAGKRTDNLTDSTFTNLSEERDIDIDFGAAHAPTITAEELGLISRWIDLGSPGGSDELRDTQKPTLNISAIVNAGGISELRVGTVDLGSGIEPKSLVVCVLEAHGNCNNLAVNANMHGVTVVNLSESDPKVEIRARVADKSGNETVVIRTVGFLLNNPAPPPAPVVEVIVPDTLGQTKAVAQSALEALGLRVISSSEKSSTIAEGIVIRSTPIPSTIISAGSTVNLVVSSEADDAPEANTSGGGLLSGVLLLVLGILGLFSRKKY